MPLDRLAHLEAGISETQGRDPRQKEALIRLLSDLKPEMANASKTHDKPAQHMARLTDISAHQATRLHKNPHLLHLAMEGLSTSAAACEVFHPAFVSTVKTISKILSKMGI
jgi:hypothetical protein